MHVPETKRVHTSAITLDALLEQVQAVQEIVPLLGATETVLLERAARRNDDVAEQLQKGGERALAGPHVQLGAVAVLRIATGIGLVPPLLR